MGIEVEVAAMDQAGQVFDRQKGYMTQGGTYMATNCRAPGAFKGLMSLLQGHYTSAYTSAETGLKSGGTIAAHCSTNIAKTKKTYIDKDRAAYNRLNKGKDAPPYKEPPGGGPIGAARGGYSPPDGYDPLGGKGADGRYKTQGVWGAARSSGTGLATDYTKAVASKGLDKATRPGTNTFDERDAALRNRFKHELNSRGIAPDPYSNARDLRNDRIAEDKKGEVDLGDRYNSARDRFAHRHDQDYTPRTSQDFANDREGRTENSFQRSYDRGSADAQEGLDRNAPRRPGTVWVPDNVTAPTDAVEQVNEFRDNVTGLGDDVRSLGEAYQENQDTHRAASGPSNSSARQWAGSDQGGQW